MWQKSSLTQEGRGEEGGLLSLKDPRTRVCLLFSFVDVSRSN